MFDLLVGSDAVRRRVRESIDGSGEGRRSKRGRGEGRRVAVRLLVRLAERRRSRLEPCVEAAQR